MSLNCKVGRRYRLHRDHFDYSQFLRKLKLYAFETAIAVVFLVWLVRSVWHETFIDQFLGITPAAQASPTTIPTPTNVRRF